MNDSSDNTPKSEAIAKTRSRKKPFFILDCFGFCAKNAEKKKKQKVIISDDRKKGRWRFSWLAVRRKKVELCEKVNLCKKVHAEDKIGRKIQLPVREIKTPVERLGTNLQPNPHMRKHKAAQVIKPLKHSKSSDHRNLSIAETSQPHLYLDKKEAAKKDEIALLESVEECSNPSQDTATQPTLERKNRKVTIEDQKDRVHEKDQKPQEAEKLIAKSGSIYGLSILIVTLIMMLVWGKLCAIVCTSAWFYLVQRLKRDREFGVSVNSAENGSNRIQSNIVNQAHKKKVVFDGFLERNNRKALKILS